MGYMVDDKLVLTKCVLDKGYGGNFTLQVKEKSTWLGVIKLYKV
jgi:hypothetical protein